MKRARLQALLERCAQLTVLVVGDFFLDKYLHIDEALAEPSLETGLVAHQVVRVTCSPGAAGTVAVNLRALGVHVRAIGVAGVDGECYDLMQALAAHAIDTTHLLQVPGLRTPAYYKPMLHNATQAHELNRIDIKNRKALPDAVQAGLCNRLRIALQDVQGVIIADQVVQPECGVIGSRMRADLTAAAAAHSQLKFAVDSRARIGSFRKMLLKPNQHEALAATGREPTATDLKSLAAAGAELQASGGRCASHWRSVVRYCARQPVRSILHPVLLPGPQMRWVRAMHLWQRSRQRCARELRSARRWNLETSPLQ